jgi:hypothetical protein
MLRREARALVRGRQTRVSRSKDFLFPVIAGALQRGAQAQNCLGERH